MSGKLIAVVGGQFGSEAKGHVAGRLAEREWTRGNKVVAVRVAGPNAGHTAYDKLGRAHALRTIPVMAVTNPQAKLVIAAGSEIQLSVLFHEIETLEAAGIPIRDRLYIDAEASVLEDRHIQTETDATMHERLGSTGKGVGAVRADRLMRKARRWTDLTTEERGDVGRVDTAALIAYEMDYDATCIVEGTQGYGLGLHAGFYPYCTSSDCRAIDFYAMAGINPWARHVRSHEVWVVCRTYPIRVAGTSGPLFNELTWEYLADQSGGHIQPERTTVTKKIRRIGTWDPKLVRDAVKANGAGAFDATVRIALTFLDYIDPAIANADPRSSGDCNAFVRRVEDEASTNVSFLTTGPNFGVFA